MQKQFELSGAMRFSVAPMVDVTDSVFRRLARLFSKKSMLYTEMIAADAVIHGKNYLLEFHDEELPCVLQLGGSDPKKLAAAAKIGAGFGYTEINLNAGCPSDKVQSGNFGAVLMKTPDLIADCVKAMQDAVSVPVTVKTRIGVDEDDSVDFTLKLVETIAATGCRHVILHARKAWLNGLSPKENRTIPPLDYERVYLVKSAFPNLRITINGGITTIDAVKDQLKRVDGVMLGRAIIDNPFILSKVDSEIFGSIEPMPSREELLYKAVDLAAKIKAEGILVHHLMRHLLGLFNSCPGARLYRRYLSEHMTQLGAGPDVLIKAYKSMTDARKQEGNYGN